METRRKPDIDLLSDATAAARPVQVQIIATTDAGTRAALVEARQLSRRMNVGRTVLLVPRLGSSMAALEGAEKDAPTMEDYRQMAGETGVDVTVRLCACGRYSEAFHWMLPWGSVVVVGGRLRLWWPTREQRIAGQLKRAGYVVVFVDASRQTAL